MVSHIAFVFCHHRSFTFTSTFTLSHLSWKLSYTPKYYFINFDIWRCYVSRMMIRNFSSSLKICGIEMNMENLVHSSLLLMNSENEENLLHFIAIAQIYSLGMGGWDLIANDKNELLTHGKTFLLAILLFSIIKFMLSMMMIM
jgi:hypothetical protein